MLEVPPFFEEEVMAKYIFVTGGVVSGLGKGITAASLGRLLKARGLKVAAQKLDPYINVDPGTMSPYQHGEVYVTEDGAETDLDLGHYERFIDENLNKYSNLTSGKVYWNVLNKERRGEYLGLGLGAASLIGDMRSRNTSDLETYLDDCCAREEEETLSRQAQMEETMFLGLRCLDGISIREFEARFGQSIFSVYGEVIERYAELGLLEQHGDRILLSRRGIDVSNQVLADFLL